MTNYNDGNWHGWNGGECPVHPESVVEVCVEYSVPFTRKAGELSWTENTIVPAIIAFRVVKEHREPREWWVRLDENGILRDTSPAYIGMKRVFKVREVLE